MRPPVQEMVSCRVAVSNKPNPLKNVLPKKRSAYERKPSCSHLARSVKLSYAELAKPKRAYT